MDNRIRRVVLALAVCVCAASQAEAQAVDSMPRFSIFGGSVFPGAYTTATGGLTNIEFGGSADFRISNFPLTLRSTLAFRQQDNNSTLTPMKFGTLSLDAIGRPVPRVFGVQLYVLGGFGVATRSDYIATFTRYVPIDGSLAPTPSVFSVSRGTWAFTEGGLGLEFGRHVFVQTKFMLPVASQGPVLVPFSFGFRF